MPSIATTPAQFAITWGDAVIEPVRLETSALRLSLSMGSASFGPSLALASSSVTVPKLPRLMRQQSYFDQQGKPTLQMMNLIQLQDEKIEAAFAALTNQVTDLSSIVTAIQQAQTLAQAANTTATETKNAQDLQDSYTDPQSVLTGSNDGSVTIAAHSRVYPITGTTKAVNGGALTGLSGTVYVYYIDAGREGGAVTYQASTSPVAQTGDVHTLGPVTIPAAGEPANTGAGTPAPGVIPSSDDLGYYLP